MRPLLDSRFKQVLREHFTALATIQTTPDTTDASGQPIDGVGVDVAGMKNIPARIGPMILIRPTDDVTLGDKLTAGMQTRQLKLNGYYPNIVVDVMQASITGVSADGVHFSGQLYPIRGVEHDGQPFSTRLRLEVVIP